MINSRMKLVGEVSLSARAWVVTVPSTYPIKEETLVHKNMIISCGQFSGEQIIIQDWGY